MPPCRWGGVHRANVGGAHICIGSSCSTHAPRTSRGRAPSIWAEWLTTLGPASIDLFGRLLLNVPQAHVISYYRTSELYAVDQALPSRHAPIARPPQTSVIGVEMPKVVLLRVALHCHRESRAVILKLDNYFPLTVTIDQSCSSPRHVW